MDEWSAVEEDEDDDVDVDEDDTEVAPFESEQELKKKVASKVKGKKPVVKAPSKKQSTKEEAKVLVPSPKKKGSAKEDVKKKEEGKKGGKKGEKAGGKKTKGEESSSPKKKQAPELGKEHSRAELGNLAPEKCGKKAKKVVNIGFAAPKNVEEQYGMFFTEDCSINPKFEYENPAAAQAYVSNFQVHS